MKIFALITGLLLMAGSAPIDIDGTWSGQYGMGGPGGMGGGQPVTLTFEFKADGDNLTGVVIGPMGNRDPIQEGRIKGKRIYFDIYVDFGGSQGIIQYKGVVKGDEIELSFKNKSPVRADDGFGGGFGGGMGGSMGGGMGGGTPDNFGGSYEGRNPEYRVDGVGPATKFIIRRVK